MRIVGGDLKGRAIATPEGKTTRPTSDRARQAVFNILEHADWMPALSGLRVMDVFAGSGALGFEALSRGSAFCLFVETDDDARGAIRENIEAFGKFGVTRVHRRDATQLGIRPASAGAPFDLVFLDPPYHKGLGEVALVELVEGKWVHENSIAVLEKGADEATFLSELWEIIDTRNYGAAQVFFLKQKILKL
ncbi:16S rRNA (guanine(966)-N(2))-methyltransferase RsmD [Asticcacaulis machinosus]|uniref:16S rRNA (Guanine(966)-N(2))-methyltransferase RsmD n=1 Tax=Asticcacaulis machinosus TaxID=2984211 RepID=A0ABT5HGA6_9CAUL|nr:16S rRNA (guanine(966)-N(2))-methyltransferase RsmD [Asticcacaulis machinosus]MDC7675289.1 16S rRNA (guanine(966)-N(2))-methyltransferase RsmD [Asticcacaulis machinosus]